MADGSAPRPIPRAPARLRPLLGELGDLKRIRSAGRDGSVARRGFRQAWCELAAGEPSEAVAKRTVAAALAAARLGDLDGPKLLALGLPATEALEVLRRAFDAVAVDLDPALAAILREGLTLEPRREHGAPAFVHDLERQPRAGATCPDKPRIVLEPPEDHAEHCWAVAVFGVLLCPAYGADPVEVFTASLAHHLHNALMPDSGFTGEILLGDRLADVIDHATAHALLQLDEPLRDEVRRSRRILPDADTPEGRAFHAADVIDRVTQIAQHLRPASISMTTVLVELELVHDGPVKPFHDRVVAEMGLP